MISYILKRLLQFIPTFLGITLIVFILIHLVPGKPTIPGADLNVKTSLDFYEKIKKIYGLDKPLLIQYLLWLKKVLTFDFGVSISDNRPVIEKIKERAGITLIINLIAIILIFLIGGFIGIVGALKRGKFFDNFTTVLVFIGYSVPSFWFALLCIQFFCVRLQIFPVSGVHSLNYEALSFLGKIKDFLWHISLPVLVTCFGALAGITRYFRQSLIEVLNKEFVIALKAKGLPKKRLLFSHILKNALLPIITLIGLSIPGLLGGSVIFESIFSIPGMGKLFYEAVMMRDYFLIMGLLTIGAILTFLGNLIADICYALVDPRIKYQKPKV